MSHPLDNMVWEALGGPQFRLGATNGRVRYYDPTIAMFAGVADPWTSDFQGLPRGTSFGFVTTGPVKFPGEIEVLKTAELTHMTAEHPKLEPRGDELVALSDANVPEMMALVDLTYPGPFAARTIKMGKFWGALHDGHLVAMAGERMRLTGYTEVSAVCTHPDYRGKGYARELVSTVVAGIVSRGETSFLQVYPENAAAISLYESMGFAARRPLWFTIIRRT